MFQQTNETILYGFQVWNNTDADKQENVIK